MISELEKIQSGLVETTVEFDTQRKVIGVATTNLLPNENGIVPLSKQGAFQIVEQAVETVDFTEAVNDVQNSNNEELIEQLDLPVLGETQEPSTLQEPVHSDVLTESPVSVENPGDLSGFKIPEPVVEEEPAVMEPIGPVVADIQMPQMPETIVANEPEVTNQDIFESIPTLQQEEPQVNDAPQLTQSEEILNSIPTAEQVSEEAPLFEAVDELQAPMGVNIEMPVMEENPQLQVTDPVEDLNPLPETMEALNSEPEQSSEVIPTQNNVPEILDIDKIIENNKKTLLAYADELIKTAEQIKEFVNKSFDEINETVKNAQNHQTPSQEITQPQQTITNQVNNMVTTGNNLVDDAISRINAISEPAITL